jgi:parvulin-like peptidyl-prolyl isomerase
MNRFVFLSVLMALLMVGCQGDGKSAMTDAELERIALTQRIELVEAGGGLVLVVGGETITSEQVIESLTELNGRFVSPVELFKPLARMSDLEQFTTRARGQIENIITGRISGILLYQHARNHVGKNNIDEALDRAAENELRKFVLSFGGNQAKADEELKKRGMDRESFKKRQKRSMLIQSYISSKMSYDRPITYRELRDCYNEIKDERFARDAKITFRLIDIQPARLQVADPNQDRRQLAKALADNLLVRLKSGDDFSELAKQYSHGPFKDKGGLWPSLQPQSLAAPYDMIAGQALRTEPGQVAEPIISKEHVFIMKLEEKQAVGYQPFAQVQEDVEKEIMSNRRNEVYKKLNESLIEEAKLDRADEFVDFCLEKIYRLSRQQQ